MNDVEFMANLRDRLDKIPYPYKPARAQQPGSMSTYKKLEKHGVARVLFEPHVLTMLKMWSEFREYWRRHNELHLSNTVKGKNFRDFHRSLATELTRHAAAVRALRDGYDVGEEWAGPYLRTVEMRLLDELLVRRTYIDLKPEPDTVATREALTGVYWEVSSALRTANVTNQALAHHLTSIICSPNCLITGTLDPNPENLGRSFARWADKTSRKSRH